MVFWMMRSSQYLGSSFFQFDEDIVINHKPYMPQGLWVLNFETACHCTNPLHQPRNLCSAQHNSNANCASIGGPANPGECHLVQDFNWDHTTSQWWDEDSKNLQPRLQLIFIWSSITSRHLHQQIPYAASEAQFTSRSCGRQRARSWLLWAFHHAMWSHPH